MEDAEELDVDWTLVDWFLSLTPLERLQTVESYAYGYDQLPEDSSDTDKT